MLNPPQDQVHVAPDATDMRKSTISLTLLTEIPGIEPVASHWFVFYECDHSDE